MTKDIDKKLDGFLSGRDIGLSDKYIAYINRLDDEELRREYFKQKSKNSSSEKIIQPFIITMALAFIYWLTRFYIYFTNERLPALVEYIKITENEAATLSMGVLYLIVIFVLLTVVSVISILFSLDIRKKRFLYVEYIVNKKNVFKEADITNKKED